MAAPEPRSPLRDRDILLVSSDDYEAGLTTSKHQLTRRLVRDNRVLFIESVGLRRPGASGKDLRRIVRKIGRFLRGPRRLGERLWIFTPLVIPFHDLPWARALNRWFLARCVRRVARRLGFEAPLLWLFLPTAAGLVGEVGESLVVYYNVDDFAQFRGSDVATVTALDEELTRAADVVFASARAVAERKREVNPNTWYSPHGVDVEHFRKALEAPPPPADIADLSGPIVGYWGWIADYFDLDSVAAVAAARPDWTLLLIGEATISLTSLSGLRNVRILGPRPYESLPAYAAQCEVLLIPRKLTALTQSMNPLKLREYLATGRPVVSAPLPEVVEARDDCYGDAVSIASNGDEYVAAIAAHLAIASPERRAA
ncbi:MAG: glycosyltransferase, partial [Armatimonadetes bacterium]|nr:glycosyltransferase [Armatimonadota bacterium]